MNTVPTPPPTEPESPTTVRALIPFWQERERRYANAALVGQGEEKIRDEAAGEAFRTCASELDRVALLEVNETMKNARQIIMQAIEDACQERIKEIEGHGASPEEVTAHLACNVNADASTAFLWKGQVIAFFYPARFTVQGYKDASVHKAYPAPSVPN